MPSLSLWLYPPGASLTTTKEYFQSWFMPGGILGLAKHRTGFPGLLSYSPKCASVVLLCWEIQTGSKLKKTKQNKTEKKKTNKKNLTPNLLLDGQQQALLMISMCALYANVIFLSLECSEETNNHPAGTL